MNESDEPADLHVPDESMESDDDSDDDDLRSDDSSDDEHDDDEHDDDEHDDDGPDDEADDEADDDERVARLERRLLDERADRRDAERAAERSIRDLQQTIEGLEGRLAERTAEMRRSIAAVTAASQAKDRFLAQLGRELTTTLPAVLDRLAQIDSKQLDPADQDRLAAARGHGGELSHLLAGLVELAGAAGAARPEDAAERNPASWLDEFVSSWTRPAGRRGHLLVPSLTAPGDPVRLDWKRLRRIADAALENIAVHATAGAVSIDLTVEPEQVVLVMTDAGPGMDDVTLATALEPFVSHGPSAGLGLGLALAHRLALDGGGSINLTSEEATTTVVVALPRLQ